MEEYFGLVKNASRLLARSSYEERRRAILNIYDTLNLNRDLIKKENDKDLDNAKKEDSALANRLLFSEEKIDSCLKGLLTIASLPDPIGKTREKREIDDNFILEKRTFPLGVIGMVFEARPDALVQIAALALMSGNGIILKGGKEAKYSNILLYNLIKEATSSLSFSQNWIYLLETREDVLKLLKAEEYVDLIIPRGSSSFVRFVMDNTRIPVMGHSEGLCTTYVDEEIENDGALRIVIDGKTNYPEACNSTETILVNKKIASHFLPLLSRAFEEKNVIVHCDEYSLPYFPYGILSNEEDYYKEYLRKECAIKVVSCVEEAVEHILKHGSGHTDAIVTNNKKNADFFIQNVDSADVFVNCSTRFADGFRFGLGAEVGISTSRLHARGPVGLDGLMTTKWILCGNGECVSDYSKNGSRTFKYKELV